MIRMNTSDMSKSSSASDQSTSLCTVPIASLPMPMVSTDVSVDAGVNRLVGIWIALPMTICTASASPNARVIPKMTAVISDGAAERRTTFHTVCQRVQPSA